MAIMNRAGVFLYNLALFLTIGILFLTLKNYNIEEPGATLDYSRNLKYVLFGLVWAYYAFGLTLSIASLVSKARKKRIFFTLMMLWFWAAVAVNALFIFLPDILDPSITTPAWRYTILLITISVAFIPALGLIFYMFPGTVDRNFLVKQVKDKLVKEQVKAKSYCPECKFPSEKEWKYCPKCGVHFSD